MFMLGQGCGSASILADQAKDETNQPDTEGTHNNFSNLGYA